MAAFPHAIPSHWLPAGFSGPKRLTGQANEIFPDGRGFVVGPTDDDTTDLPIFGASAQDLDRIVNTKLFHGQNSFDLLLKNDDEEQEAPLHNRRDSFDILPDNFNDDDTNERQEAQPYNSQDSFDLLPNNADNSQRAPPHNDQRSLARFHAAWFRLINSYSTRSLSFPRKDKLLALSAIAQRVQSATGYGYVAGLWDHPLVLSLLWRVCGPGVQERPKDYQAPTWSWASVNSPVRGVTPMKRWDSVAEVLDTKVETHKGDKRQTGQVFGGFVEMRGILWEMPHLTAIKENEEEEDEKDVKFTGEEEKEKDMERSDHNNSGYGSFDMYAGNMALGKLFSDVRMVELPEQACLLPLRVRSTESPSSDPAVQGIVLVYKGDCFERLGAFSIDADVVVDGIDGWERVDMVIR
ncbi:hypothetical protein K490DRAFT_54940 [Saccharata proteae CBS 121410]|uniref:Uncharacterized protein n=1 Tax=Saccharata proteae CBS 121410 TaxID=1314787 RepID=A0A6A5YCT5_9PEZI|nr:hypothetical protein K490DRAFT_54940 [Saccharata proteae CBS 121410]